jgi:hypothetical protein
MFKALSELVTGAFFFACRSCEYLRVVSRGRTKLLRLRNIVFTTADYKTLPHNTPNIVQLAEYVSITFEEQKNSHKFEKRTQSQNNDATLCPVKSWALVVSRILSYNGTNEDSPVNMFQDPKNQSKTIYFSQSSLNIFLRFTVKEKPHLHFGYDYQHIGTHSIRSGAAMALYLADTHPHKIMLLGRWSSDAFILYLRPEVFDKILHKIPLDLGDKCPILKNLTSLRWIHQNQTVCLRKTILNIYNSKKREIITMTG